MRNNYFYIVGTLLKNVVYNGRYGMIKILNEKQEPMLLVCEKHLDLKEFVGKTIRVWGSIISYPTKRKDQEYDYTIGLKAEHIACDEFKKYMNVIDLKYDYVDEQEIDKSDNIGRVKYKDLEKEWKLNGKVKL